MTSISVLQVLSDLLYNDYISWIQNCQSSTTIPVSLLREEHVYIERIHEHPLCLQAGNQVQVLNPPADQKLTKPVKNPVAFALRRRSMFRHVFSRRAARCNRFRHPSLLTDEQIPLQSCNPRKTSSKPNARALHSGLTLTAEHRPIMLPKEGNLLPVRRPVEHFSLD